jgi:hypothetical protein
MTITAQAIADHILSEVQSAAPDRETSDATGRHFCSLWAQARPVLHMLSGIVGFIPGFGQTAAAVLRGLLKVGDEISNELCE